MRGLLSFLSLSIAIAGLLIVIAFSASEAYLNIRDDEVNLNNALLLGSLAPEGWTPIPGDRAAVDAEFRSPCLAVPLLDGASISGRGAMTYAPPPDTASGVHLWMIATKPADAGMVMSSVRRDTENDCRRGVTVGTVSDASVSPLAGSTADEAILVQYTRNEAGEIVTVTEAVIREGDYISLLRHRHDPQPVLDTAGLAALAGRVIGQIETPPTPAELEAAGAAENPAIFDRASERIQSALTDRLSLDGRVTPYAGLGLVGGLAILFYLFGAKLSAGRGATASSSAPISPVGATPPSHPTLDNYSTSRRRWIRPREPIVSATFEEDDGDQWDTETPPVEPAQLPVLDFPQRSIQEKLRILKEARLREPRPEPLTASPVVPAVDWTEEISKPSETPRPAPPAAPVTRKVLLQKLRSESGHGNSSSG